MKSAAPLCRDGQVAYFANIVRVAYDR